MFTKALPSESARLLFAIKCTVVPVRLMGYPASSVNVKGISQICPAVRQRV
jgi:hypothetical protein